MIKLLGKNTVAFIALLVLLDGGIAYGYYDYLQPIRAEQEAALAKTKAEVEARRQEVSKMKEEFVLLQSQLRNFKELEYDGFFDNQDRQAATELLDDLSLKAGLLKASLEGKAGELVADAKADDAQRSLLRTAVTVPMDSLDDVDVYTFLKFLDRDFPGMIDITALKIDRIELLNAAMLRKIGGGDPTTLVKAKLEFDWYTMIPKNASQAAGKGN